MHPQVTHDLVMIVVLWFMMVHMLGALMTHMLVWKNQLHDWMPWKEISSNNFDEFLSSGMSGNESLVLQNKVESNCSRIYRYVSFSFDPLVVGINVWMHYGMLVTIVIQINNAMIALFKFSLNQLKVIELLCV